MEKYLWAWRYILIQIHILDCSIRELDIHGTGSSKRSYQPVTFAINSPSNIIIHQVQL
jgi:hypothetical protein